MAMQEFVKANKNPEEDRVTLKNVGDKFTGLYVGAESGVSKKGRKYTKHYFKDGGGKMIFIFGDRVLNDDLPAMGVDATIEITFTGKAPTKSGDSYNTYKFRWEKPEPSGL